jgi:subtilisin family serine protease
VLHVESNTIPPSGPLVESIVVDENNPIQLLDFDLTLVDTVSTAEFTVDDEKNWWKVASIKDIDFESETYTHTVRGFGGTVYILDSGLETSHPEFQGVDVQLLHSFTNEFSDTRGHGTALASLISGKTCGLTGATIKVVKIFDTSVSTYQSDMLAAFDAVLNDYITNGRTLSVVNLSWGMIKNEYIDAKINYLRSQGLNIVAAAGNSGVPIDNVTPASIPAVLTVGAYNQSLTPCDFSNYTGESIISVTNEITNTGALDIWAPGEKIWAAGLNGTYGYIAGTSAAAAITSGAIIYNLSRYVNDTGFGTVAYRDHALLNNRNILWDETLTSIIDPTDLDFLYSAVTLAKRFEIDLSQNNVYANSTSTAVAYSRFGSGIFNNNLLRVRAIAGKSSYKYLFDKTQIEKITTESLPEHCTIDANGSILFDFPDMDEPYKFIPATAFDVYSRDGSINTVLLEIIVIRNDINSENAAAIIESESITDPVVRIYLLFGCYVNGQACTGSCAGTVATCQPLGYTSKGTPTSCECNG